MKSSVITSETSPAHFIENYRFKVLGAGERATDSAPVLIEENNLSEELSEQNFGQNGENFVPFREFEVSGDQQNSVTIRVYGLGNSDTPKTKGLTFVKSVAGLNFVTRLVGRKEEVHFEASELRFEK